MVAFYFLTLNVGIFLFFYSLSYFLVLIFCLLIIVFLRLVMISEGDFNVKVS